MRRPNTIVAVALALLAPASQFEVRAQMVVLDPFVITATRGLQNLSDIPASVRALDAEELSRTPALTLDGALRSVPGFSLFRRSDSLTAHPTTQGVSLRGLGPSGASRTLVLLDGVPVNDPFGGWIAWSKLPRLSLDRIEIVRGGGATVWGNAALGGVIHLLSREPDAPSFLAQLQGGANSLGSVEFAGAQYAGSGVIELSGNVFRTDGFRVVAPEDRGPVDIAAWQRHQWLSARWSFPLGEDTTVAMAGRLFSEKRGNGTALQNNRSRDLLGSLSVKHHPKDGLKWSAVLFAEDEKFSSAFSSVSADRTGETPASSQFSVPATAWGLSWTATIDSDNAHAMTLGADFRSVRGETNEDSGYSNGSFTRRRVAGGEQQIGGLFVVDAFDVSESVRIVAGMRADYWSDTGGFRREALIETGVLTRSDSYPDRDGWEFSPSAGAVWRTSSSFALHASAQRAFRRPTLNELYRPFRVGSIITESNPVLGTEFVSTLETGFKWTHGRFNATGTLFRHDMSDAVANVTLVHGPGNFPDFGFIPAGGVGRKRFNLSGIVVQGLELGASLAVGETTIVTAEYLLSDARVNDGDPDPTLDGKRLAEVPRHSATVSIEWRGPRGFHVVPRLRFLSRQFEDDENTLPLAAVFVADLRISVPVSKLVTLFLVGENLGDARIEAGKSTAGVTTVGTPRTLTGGVQIEF